MEVDCKPKYNNREKNNKQYKYLSLNPITSITMHFITIVVMHQHVDVVFLLSNTIEYFVYLRFVQRKDNDNAGN